MTEALNKPKINIIGNFKQAKQALRDEILERRKAEAARLKTERRLCLHMENSPLAVVEWDRDFIVTLWAGEAENIFGWSAEETVGKPIMDLHMIYDDDVQIVQKTIERLMDGTSRHVVSSNRNYTKDRRVINCTWYNSITHDDGGKMSSVLSLVLDNTDLVATQEALRESEKRYRSYIEVTGQISWTTDADGIVNTDLPTWRQYTGQVFDEIKGWGWSKALHSDDVAHTERVWRQSVAERREYEAEYRIRRYDGVYRHFLARGIPVFKEDGTILEWVGTCIDITERKKAEELLRRAHDELEASVRERTVELQKANEALQTEILERERIDEEKKKIEAQMLRAQRMESIGTLAAGIAHDFNNILTPIMLNSTAALMDMPKKSPARKHIEHILKSADRAKDLVEHMLTYSRKGEYDLKAMNFQDVLMEALKFIRASIPSIIEIRQKIESCGPLLADPTQMHQVVMNLCTNAYQAMRESGGILELALAEVDIDEEFARSHMNLRPCRYVRFTVRDTGHGMDEATMERIFDPFFTTKGTGGTGLGLSVVHGIVISHGGDIDVQSQPGKGTTFQIYLPRASEQLNQVEAKKDEPVLTGKERILFVDDEAEIASMGKEMLERLGYAVTAKTDSPEALEEFRTNPEKYDLVVTDYTMPKMNGLELAKELNNIRPDILVVLASGFNDEITSEKRQTSGISSTLKKPYAITDLAKSLRQLMDAGTAR